MTDDGPMTDDRPGDQLALQVGHLLRTERLRARLSQAALARAAGTSQQSLSRFETGAYAPTTTLVARLFAALGRQVRVDVEVLDADLDRAIHEAMESTDEEDDLLEGTLDNFATLCRRAGDLRYLLDGELAALLHGVPVPRPAGFAVAVAEADLAGLSAWVRAIPNCRRWSPRWRDFSVDEVDPARAGALRWSTPYGELTARLVRRLPEPVRIRVGERVLAVRPLIDVVADNPQVARVVARVSRWPSGG